MSKRNIKATDDLINDFMIFYKSNDFHLCTAFGAEKRVYLIDFADHLCPAFGGDNTTLSSSFSLIDYKFSL
jgi:hypothetical protein